MISKLAVVESTHLGRGVIVQEFSIIRENVFIGDDTIVHPYVVISPGVRIGAGVEVFPGAVIGKEPRSPGSLSRPLEYKRNLMVGDGSIVGVGAVLYYDVEIGRGTLIGDGASIRESSRVGDQCVIGRYVTINYSVVIGNRTKIMDHTWLAGNMVIGKDVFISGCVATANDNGLGRTGYREEEIIGPTIEDGAVIGAGAVILPKVVLGRGCRVGAGAVVTRNVPPGVTVKGIPARMSQPT